MQDTTFIEINRQNTRKAVQRARERRPHVRCLSVQDRIYSVSASSGNGERYICRLAAAGGKLLGACECLGSERGRICYHLAACAGFASGIKKARRLAEERALDARHGIRREGRRAWVGAIEV
jgi:hypothetical protein